MLHFPTYSLFSDGEMDFNITVESLRGSEGYSITEDAIKMIILNKGKVADVQIWDTAKTGNKKVI